jgi:predicted MFS family arabinose efflux permease
MRLPAVLWPMMFGNAVIGTGVMMIPGLLQDLSASLQVTAAEAGQLISLSALLVCLGAPPMAMAVARWDRRRLLVGCLVWYALLHALAALAPGYASLLGLRMLAMAAAAVFTPQAAACIGLLVPVPLRGRAITFVFLGWSVASVIGTPLGAWIGGHWGWRWSFALISGVSLLSALALARRMPSGVVPPTVSGAAWRQILGSPTLMSTLGVTVLSAGGQFTMFSYLAPFVVEQHGATPSELSLLLLAYGLCGFIGNSLTSRWIDRMGASRAVMAALTVILLGLFLVNLTHSLVWLTAAMLPWGLGVFASNSSQQARLVGLAPHLAPASIALNTSALYAGQAMGAALGGWLLVHQGLQALPQAGVLLLVLAMGLSAAASWQARHRPLPRLS